MPPAVPRKLFLPDLGLAETPVVVSRWHVAVGQVVIEGDRLLEVLAGNVTVDLPAPASGILSETLVAPQEPLTAGQTLAIILES